MKVKPGQIWKVCESKFMGKNFNNPEDYFIVITKLTTRYDKPWVDFFYLDSEDLDSTPDDSTSVEWLKLNAELESDIK